MYEIRQVNADEMLDHAQLLFNAHWDEIAINKQGFRPNPDRDTYLNLESSGALFIFAAYSGEELVGYSVNIIARMPHCMDLITATNDILFVTKQHRKGGVGLQLIAASEDEAKRRGAKLFLCHAKQDTALNSLLPRIGYCVQEIVYSKVI